MFSNLRLIFVGHWLRFRLKLIDTGQIIDIYIGPKEDP